MSPYVLVFFGFFVFMANSYMSFNKSIHDKWWFPLALVACSMTAGLMWSFICKGASSAREIYTLSSIWDFIIKFAFYVFPVLFYSIKLNWQTVIGVLLVFAGCVVVKLGEVNG